MSLYIVIKGLIRYSFHKTSVECCKYVFLVGNDIEQEKKWIFIAYFDALSVTLFSLSHTWKRKFKRVLTLSTYKFKGYFSSGLFSFIVWIFLLAFLQISSGSFFLNVIRCERDFVLLVFLILMLCYWLKHCST